jgi:hypothetical protein
MKRRTLLSVAASAPVLAATKFTALAHEATPAAREELGVAIARIRKLPTPELADAIFPDVMAHFLPGLEALPGYRGYVFTMDDQDPAAQITLTLVTDNASADEADEVARDYVSQLDPRFVVETPVAIRGPVRIFEVTDRSRLELPPFLYCTYLAMRQRVTAPGVDVPALIETARTGLVPILAKMPGFILYCWIETEGARTAINIWETLEQLQAGNEAVADFVAANTADTTIGEPVVNQGMIGYGELTALEQ